jgi:adenine C2-methylase RlmN of 23S rRNA A2503 and tRNA A37
LKTTNINQIKSSLDESTNFIFTGDYPGKMEARYVRRKDYYLACYLSSQTGCNQVCKMCHLTATQQFQLQNIDVNGYLSQAEQVLAYYEEQTNRPKAKVIHYNFMARGEALNNKHLTKSMDYHLLNCLAGLALKYNLHPRFNISTIMPKSFTGDLLDSFPIIYPDFYYSIYSVNPDFRKEWLRNAQPVDEALAKFYEWQEVTKKIVKLHWAFIQGENDSVEDVTALCNTITSSGLKTDINIVRYNPHSEEDGEESNQMVFDRNLKIMQNLLPSNTKIDIIPRVGYDAYASCGMFAS